MNFLSKFNKPIMILAPMEDVTDSVFRNLVHNLDLKGEPDIYFTEFISARGINNNSLNSKQHILVKDSELKRPLIAQLWGVDPKDFYNATIKLASLGFWGVDLNMGCPKKKIVKKGVCSALINNKTLAEEIIIATKEACLKSNLTLSVKTRHGFSRPEVESWLGFLLGFELDMLTVHPRLAINQSDGPVDFEIFKELIPLRDKISSSTLIIGNGDVLSLTQAADLSSKYSLDGIMFGRGIFKNLNLFKENSVHFLNYSLEKRIDTLSQHIHEFYDTWGTAKDFNKLKKYFKIYFNEEERESDYFNLLIKSLSYDELFINLENYKMFRGILNGE